MVAQLFQSFSLQRWLTWVAMHPRPVLIGILILTALAGTGIPRLTFSHAANELMVDGLPERQRYEDFKALFGSDEIHPGGGQRRRHVHSGGIRTAAVTVGCLRSDPGGQPGHQSAPDQSWRGSRRAMVGGTLCPVDRPGIDF